MSTLEDFKSCLSELSDVLQTESKILKAGQIFSLDDILARKTDLTRSVETYLIRSTEDERLAVRSDILRMKKIADDNGRILKGVMNGLQAAQARLELLRQREAQVGAYDKSGSNLMISDDQIRSEKRV